MILSWCECTTWIIINYQEHSNYKHSERNTSERAHERFCFSGHLIRSDKALEIFFFSFKELFLL